MNSINEFNINPGVYRHHKGGLYVVLDIITHMDNAAKGAMEPLADPLVVYRDLTALPGHVNGKPAVPHKRYARTLSEFIGTVQKGNAIVKRFTQQ